MPTIITHSFVGLIGGKIFSDSPEKMKFWLLSALLPMLPDADVVGFGFGVPYGSMLGHRGFSHSIIFALCAALIVMLAAFRRIVFGSNEWFRYAAYFFFITLSHPILDAFTNGGLGVGLFIPLDAHRYFAPFRPIEVSPIGIKRFFDGAAFSVLASEISWVWLPLSAVYFVKISVKKMFDKS